MKKILLLILGIHLMIPSQISSAEHKEIIINAQSSVKIVAKIEKMHNETENTVQN